MTNSVCHFAFLGGCMTYLQVPSHLHLEFHNAQRGYVSQPSSDKNLYGVWVYDFTCDHWDYSYIYSCDFLAFLISFLNCMLVAREKINWLQVFLKGCLHLTESGRWFVAVAEGCAVCCSPPTLQPLRKQTRMQSQVVPKP